MPFLIISSSSLSQTITDRKDRALEKSARLLKEKEVLKERISVLEDRIDVLKEKLIGKDSLLSIYIRSEKIDSNIVNTYKAEIASLKEQINIAKTEANQQNKYFRRQKRKTVFIAIAGPVVTAAAFIYFKK